MNRDQYEMVQKLSKLNDEIIADKDAAFEIVSDFTKDNHSETINRILEKLLCIDTKKDVTNLCNDCFIEESYKNILSKVFFKIYKGESFIVDKIIL